MSAVALSALAGRIAPTAQRTRNVRVNAQAKVQVTPLPVEEGLATEMPSSPDACTIASARPPPPSRRHGSILSTSLSRSRRMRSDAPRRERPRAGPRCKGKALFNGEFRAPW